MLYLKMNMMNFGALQKIDANTGLVIMHLNQWMVARIFF